MAKTAFIFAFLCLFALINAQCPANSLNFTIDFNQQPAPFPHVWERCVGSGHALLALRADYRQQLQRAHLECGFEYVRFHAIMDDDMSTYLPQGNTTYSFFNVDSIFDFLLSIGMRPVVELSFMPTLLASCQNTVFHYNAITCPPTVYSEWADLVTAFAAHAVERYGVDEVSNWFFEVWNEPNCGFWTGNQTEYFKMYNYTANAVKAASPLLNVGGPVTCESQWIPEFLNFVNSNNVPLDFISTHEYPTDITPQQRNTLSTMFNKTRQQIPSDLPLFYTEYNSGLDPELHDTTYASAFVMNTVLSCNSLVDLYSYWTFSDIFEEGGFSSTPFHELYGMLNIHNIAKPAYRAFQLLHMAGDFIFTTPSNEKFETVQAIPTLINERDRKIINIIVFNHNVYGSPIQPQQVCLTLSGLPLSGQNATITRIDEENANAPNAWVSMGSPQYPTWNQIAQLQAASELVFTDLPYTTMENGDVQFTILVPPEGIASIYFPLK